MKLLSYGAVSLLGLVGKPYLPSMASWANTLFVYACFLTLSVCVVLLVAGDKRHIRRGGMTRRTTTFGSSREET